jgi:prepilin-type processing-associated H-X9-DG protein
MPDTPFSPPPKPASEASILKIVVVLVAALVCGSMIVTLFMPTVYSGAAPNRAQCMNNLKQIGLALLIYESKNGAFPPAVFTDEHGKPMMSWRVAILPYLEQQALYQKYDSKQPWDSPQNRALGKTVLPFFRCPSDPGASANPTETNYVRIVGKDTIGGMPNEAVKASDITDGPSNTILVVELSGLQINWSEPRDVTVEDLMEIVAKGHASFHGEGFNAVFADGHVDFIRDSINPKTLRALLLRNDGQPVGDY